jgi:hypothetical protein
MKKIFLILITLLPVLAYAAVGCDLNDPDRDVKRFFPDSTAYKTTYISIAEKGGDQLLRKIENRLGDTFTGIYETSDVPFTIYTIYRNQAIIGYIHGVNQKGQYGGIQVFLAISPNGIINNFYYQRLTSRQAAALKSPTFAKQFVGLSLTDFTGYKIGTDNTLIKNPAPESEKDYLATLRGVKKNLILLDEFVLNKTGGK